MALLESRLQSLEARQGIVKKIISPSHSKLSSTYVQEKHLIPDFSHKMMTEIDVEINDARENLRKFQKRTLSAQKHQARQQQSAIYADHEFVDTMNADSTSFSNPTRAYDLSDEENNQGVDLVLTTNEDHFDGEIFLYAADKSIQTDVLQPDIKKNMTKYTAEIYTQTAKISTKNQETYTIKCNSDTNEIHQLQEKILSLEKELDATMTRASLAEIHVIELSKEKINSENGVDKGTNTEKYYNTELEELKISTEELTKQRDLRNIKLQQSRDTIEALKQQLSELRAENKMSKVLHIFIVNTTLT